MLNVAVAKVVEIGSDFDRRARSNTYIIPEENTIWKGFANGRSCWPEVTADTPTGRMPAKEIDAWVATLERTMKLPSSYIQIAK